LIHLNRFEIAGSALFVTSVAVKLAAATVTGIVAEFVATEGMAGLVVVATVLLHQRIKVVATNTSVFLLEHWSLFPPLALFTAICAASLVEIIGTGCHCICFFRIQILDISIEVFEELREISLSSRFRCWSLLLLPFLAAQVDRKEFGRARRCCNTLTIEFAHDTTFW